MDIQSAIYKLKETYGWSEDLENQIISLNKQLKEDYRGSFKLKKLKSRNKKGRNGDEVGKNQLSRATLKLHFQSVCMFLNWLATPKSEYGKGILK